MAAFTGFSAAAIETYTAPTNIAVIKYWGKNDVKLNTPMNSSASLTLDQSDLHTITTVAASKDVTEDRLWLNGTEIEINGRGRTCLAEIRKLAQDRLDPATGEVVIRAQDWPQYRVHIASINTFPTGAGLASSAAGLACLVSALAALYCAKEVYPGQLTAIARQGSGSASRSMFGGFVRWQKGAWCGACWTVLSVSFSFLVLVFWVYISPLLLLLPLLSSPLQLSISHTHTLCPLPRHAKASAPTPRTPSPSRSPTKTTGQKCAQSFSW